MSSYNNIEKIKYASEDCVVNLEEYIVFEDERAEQKFVVFKFANNVNQQLLGMEFEVSQYDVEGNLVEKSVVIYNKFLAKPVQSFVPNAKLKVNYACKTLSVRLILAAFDRFVWKEGQFLDNSYKFEHYASDEDAEAAKKFRPAAPVKVKEQKPAPAPKRRKGKLPFTAKNATKKNIAKFPAVFNAITCILAIACIGLSVYFFNLKSTSFVIDDIYYEIQEGGEVKTVAVTGYDGEEKNLTVPAQVNGYTVVRVKEKAFENSDIETVKFSSTYLYIEGYAFGGCTQLKTVISVAEATVMGYAFENCTKLETVILPDATLLKYSLNGCSGLKNLTIGKNGADGLEELFGGKVPANLEYVEGVKPEIPDEGDPDDGDDGDGSDDSGSSGDTSYDPTKTYEYGELQNVNMEGYEYEWTENYETVNGEIVTVKPDITELTLAAKVSAISKTAYSQLGNIGTLTVYSDSILTPEVMQAFTEVNTLTIENHADADELINLDNFNSLTILTIPCYDDNGVLSLYTVTNGLIRLTLNPTKQYTIIPDYAFDGVSAVNIVVAEGFTECGTNILGDGNTSVYSLTLPQGVTYGEGTIGEGCENLMVVEVWLANSDVSYCDFNKSYEYTQTLIIRAATLGGYGYITTAATALEYIEIYAADCSVDYLYDFVFGSETAENYPFVTVYISDLPSDFTENYPNAVVSES